MNSDTLIWIVPTLLALFLYGIGQGLVKKNIVDVAPARFCLFFVVAKAFVNLGYYFTQDHPSLLAPEGLSFAGIGLVAYLLDGAAWILYFESIVAGPITIVGTLSAAYPAITVLLARIFLNELLTDLQYLGVAGVIFGCIALSYSPDSEQGKKILKRWVPLATIALLVWGVSQTLIKHAYTLPLANEANLAVINTIGGLFTLGVYGFLRGRTKKNAKGASTRSWGEWQRSFVPMAVMAAGDLAVLVAVKSGPVSIVIPVSGAYPVVTLGFAYFILKERLTPLHWAGVTAVVVGIFLASGT